MEQTDTPNDQPIFGAQTSSMDLEQPSLIQDKFQEKMLESEMDNRANISVDIVDVIDQIESLKFISAQTIGKVEPETKDTGLGQVLGGESAKDDPSDSSSSFLSDSSDEPEVKPKKS